MNKNEHYESIEKTFSDLRDLLKQGNKIRTKFITGSEWINNIITFVDYDNFEISLKVIYVINNICKGDAMAFKYLHENYEYVLYGIVDEINLYENLINISVYKIEEYLNKRKDPRFDISLCSYIIYEYNQKPVYALIQNISKSGISTVTKSDIDIGSTFGINIFLSKDKIISLVAKVLRKTPNSNNFLYDSKIESINTNSRELFNELFSILEKYDDEIFYNYINSLNKS